MKLNLRKIEVIAYISVVLRNEFVDFDIIYMYAIGINNMSDQLNSCLHEETLLETYAHSSLA